MFRCRPVIQADRVEEADLMIGHPEGDLLGPQSFAVQIHHTVLEAADGDLIGTQMADQVGEVGVEAVLILADDHGDAAD